MSSPRHTYLARIHRVTDYIDAHLAEPLDLATLAGVAHFSVWHFHRLFQALTGETLADRVRRRRLEVAAWRLGTLPPEPVSTIAMEVGFGSPEVFNRAFKAHFGVSPTAWRAGANQEWAARQRERLGKIHQAQRKPHQDPGAASTEDDFTGPWGPQPLKGTRPMPSIDIVSMPARRVAYLRHVGPYGSPDIGRTWERFCAWAASRDLLPPGQLLLGVSQDNPDLAAPEQCRYDACVPVADDFRPEGEIGVQSLPARRYACSDFHGAARDIHAAWMTLCAALPDSSWQPDDGPPLECYTAPIEMDPKTGAFACRLCMPVRPL